MHDIMVAERIDSRFEVPGYSGAVAHERTASRSCHKMRALRKLQRESAQSPFFFASERGAPFATAGFAKMVERASAAAGFDFKVHPHMLRHARGFALANAGHDTRALRAYLGHRNIQQRSGTPNWRQTGSRISGGRCEGVDYG
jgi:integrase